MLLMFGFVFLFFFFQFYICRFSFLADVDECKSSTPVCGINFSCRNTLGSFRCEYKPRGSSCQGKKSMSCVFKFVMARFNTGEKKKMKQFMHTGHPPKFPPRSNKTRDIHFVCIIINVLQITTSSHDFTRPCVS